MMAGGLGRARHVAHALRVVDHQHQLLAARERLDAHARAGPRDGAADAPQIELVAHDRRYATDRAVARRVRGRAVEPGRGMETYTLRRRADATPSRQFRIDYAGELNEAQYRAATTVEGPVLVIAGAGSGKTRTLTYRVARLVESGVPPGRILLLTFTRKAAEQMLARASVLVGGNCDRVAGGTFHSFANTVLRRVGRAVGLEPNFTILDRSDAEDVVNLLRARAGLDRKERRFPRKAAILDVFSMAVNRNVAVPDLIEDDYGHLADHLDDLLRLHDAYGAYKRQQGLVDYDDLLVLLRDLLRDHADVAAQLSRTYRYVMVDEYQDTNTLQADIVRGLAVEHANVMAVGDDSQSIYSFRGANFRNIMDFERLFPGTRVVTLDENYRSTQPILRLANAIIDRAPEKYTKILHTSRVQGEIPVLLQCADEEAQARFVCQRILELREEGLSLDDVAVLFRSSYHSFDLELELQRHDIPFVKRGGFKFMETAHVKDVLAHLRLLANPRDAVSWHRVLLLLDGLGPKTAGDVIAHVGQSASVEDAVARLGTYPRRGAYSKELGRLGELLLETAGETLPVEEKVSRVVGFYVPMLRHKHPEDFPKREKDLEHFLTIAARYRSLDALLADMALEPPNDSVNEVLAAEVDEGYLTLSTIHSAKGLEWKAVFVIGLVDGRFPSLYNLRSDEEVEEERRLLYVAVTRAKDHLYLSYPIDVYDRASGMVLGKPSRFLDALPGDILSGLQVVDEHDDEEYA
jgi:DNA helicase-2/ATP-dependent DNA helicase PcrA